MPAHLPPTVDPQEWLHRHFVYALGQIGNAWCPIASGMQESGCYVLRLLCPTRLLWLDFPDDDGPSSTGGALTAITVDVPFFDRLSERAGTCLNRSSITLWDSHIARGYVCILADTNGPQATNWSPWALDHACPGMLPQKAHHGYRTSGFGAVILRSFIHPAKPLKVELFERRTISRDVNPG